ncbi:hypothetical protein Tco_1488575 [Tanacetum coccineum]
MVDSQPMEKDVQMTKMRDAGTETQKAATKPTCQAQTTPSPSSAFIKENIDVLRTMIKELDHQAKAKATPRKLVYHQAKATSRQRQRQRQHNGKEAPDMSRTKSFSD